MKFLRVLFNSLFFFIFVITFSLTSCDSNKKVKPIKHPVTGEKLTIILLGGISDDYTYIVQGESNGKIPEEESFVSFNDSFGITYNKSSWIIYHLGKIDKENNSQSMNANFQKLSKPDYRKLVDTTEAEFFHKYYF